MSGVRIIYFRCRSAPNTLQCRPAACQHVAVDMVCLVPGRMQGAFNRAFSLLHAARVVLRLVPVAVVVLDRRLRFRVTNGAARRLFDPGEKTGRTSHFRNARPREFGIAVERIAAAARVRKQRMDMSWPAPDVVQYRVTADPAPDHVVIVAREVSPVERLGANAEAGSWFASILAAAPIGAAIYDTSLRLIDCNEAFAAIIGSPRDRILDVPIDEFRDQRLRAVLQRALKGETVTVETPYDRTTSDTWLWIRATVTPLCDAVGQVVRVVLFVEDRTREASALEPRRQVPPPRAVDVNEIVTRVSDTLRHLMGTSIAIDLRPEAALWPVFADPAQLEQLLMNLALNSRDAMPAGGTITVETASVAVGGSSLDRPGLRPGSYVMIRVTDTGPGIEPDVLPHIFEPFYTTKLGAGTGLGLSTVYGIVKQSGGYVYADSPPGAGAHLVVLLPRYSETHS